MNKNRYSKYFEKKLNAYKIEKGRTRITEKFINEFLSDKKTAAALQKNVRRYYQRGDIIDFSKIPAKARQKLKEAVKLEKTIEKQRQQKGKEKAEVRRERTQTAPTKAIQSSGSNFYFLDMDAQNFISKLQKGQGYEVSEGKGKTKTGPRYPSYLTPIFFFSSSLLTFFLSFFL